jgi:hypothetical protein
VLRNLHEAQAGTISEKAWLQFVDTRIVDERLDAIRARARALGGPDADMPMLHALIADARRLPD